MGIRWRAPPELDQWFELLQTTRPVAMRDGPFPVRARLVLRACRVVSSDALSAELLGA